MESKLVISCAMYSLYISWLACFFIMHPGDGDNADDD
jgi:hypothetical protein